MFIYKYQRGFQSMAKVKGPLLSITSSGAIAKELIYQSGNKTNRVRGYAIPKNPQTAIQQGQRSYLSQANIAWHVDGYNVLDVEAWKLLASTKKVRQSGYNAFNSLRINALKSEEDWTILKNCVISDITGEGFVVTISVASDKSGILCIGTSKVALYKEVVGVFDTDHYTFTVEDLSVFTRYFFYIKNTVANEVARSGIYTVKTVGASVLITMGEEAITRPEVDDGTCVNMGNPANLSGKITSVEIYTNWQGLTACKVATFFVVSGNYLSTRDYEVIGNVPGDQKSIYPVNIDVVAGDYIGLYFTAGYIKRDSVGLGGEWTNGADKIPCVNQLFSLNVGFGVSLKGLGLGS